MRYRLLVNLTAKTKAGSIITTDHVGAARLAGLERAGFLEVVRDDLDGPATTSPFEAALEAYRLHMEAAQPLIITVLDEAQADDEVVRLADTVREVALAMPEDQQEKMQRVFARVAELAGAGLLDIKDTVVASVSSAASEGAASMDAAPDHNAPAAVLAAGATNPEGGAVAAATVVTTSEAQTVASSDGAAAASAASNDTPEREAGAAKNTPAAKRGGPKKSGAA